MTTCNLFWKHNITTHLYENKHDNNQVLNICKYETKQHKQVYMHKPQHKQASNQANLPLADFYVENVHVYCTPFIKEI